ncbi:hypothetical protein [Lactococcus allomyrinae]|uniref:TraG P-loop domain-containing protein n=1 Tax=Lactococcus allomyrinae TaxID=2419773 RepID=A0A387BJE3_9LACT|nr:hypothetical protein [Lactococcus allomyrinae]AYG01146.1 hypothetical protein D7I46_08585 [Lactococcus allomyrinae]
MKFEPTIVEKETTARHKLPLFDRQHVKEMEAAYPIRAIKSDGQMLIVVRNKMGFAYKEYSYYLAVSPYDLTNLTPDELTTIQRNYSSLHKGYRDSMKEIYLSYPENNAAQQEYIQHLMEDETDNHKLSLQQKELDKLLFLQDAHITYTSFIQIFGSSPTKLEENYREFVRCAKDIFAKADKLRKDDVRLLLSLYNNGTQAVKRKVSRINALSESATLAVTAPQGGLVFDFPNYYVQGARFRTTVTIEGKPSLMPTWWLSNITAREQADIVTNDYLFDKRYQPLRSVDSTVTSYDKLISGSNNPTDIQKYKDEQGYLMGLAKSIREDGEIMKNVRIKVHVSAFSEAALGEKIEKLNTDLLDKNFPSTIIVNNAKVDYQSFFISYKAQEFLDDNVDIGKLRLPTEAIAEGFNHNNISLNDEMGFYIGQSLTGGSIYFNNFTKTGERLSYSMFISGVQGGGKSALTKKIMHNHYLSGGKIFGFDVNGEYRKLVKYMNGVYLPLDGSAGILNFLQVFPFVTVEDENSMEIDIEGSFESHLDTLVDRLRAIRSFDNDLASDIRGVLLDFYIDFGIWQNSKIPDVTALENTEYPTFEDLYRYANGQYLNYQNEMDEDLKKAIEYLLKTTRSIMKQYSKLLVGHTTLDQSVNNDIVFFDISRLKDGTANVYDAVFQAALGFVLGLSNKFGREEKRANDRGEKPWNKIARVLITIDECHNILKPEKYYNVSAFDILAREARKFFIAYLLDTQLIEAMLPAELSHNLSDTATFAMNKLSNIIGLTQYIILAKQSSTSIDSLRKNFSNELKPRDYKEMLSYGITEQGARMKMIIKGDKTFDFHTRLSKGELGLFAGGA